MDWFTQQGITLAIVACNIIASVLTLLRAVQAMREARQARLTAAAAKVAIADVHLLVNSRMDQLLALVGQSEKAKGVLQGREEGALK